MCTCNIKIPMHEDINILQLWDDRALQCTCTAYQLAFPCILVAGRDGGEKYPTPAEGYTTPAERWSNSAEGWSTSATRHRTPREDSSTQQATERSTNTESKE